jgi:YHS domain-containing protein
MRRGEMVAWSLGVALLGGALAVARPDEEKEIPAPFAPFEHMVGGWKGAAVPAANRIRGWPERHQWAWKFAKGVPIGMNITIEGGKIFTQALLSYNPATQQYRLEGTDPAGQPVAYVGALGGEKTNELLLDRVGAAPDGSKERLTIRPNSNLIRYTMNFDHQEPGAPQFAHYIEAGLTKEGESFAAGGAAADLPRCIVTGGTASMSVSFQGKTYPLCCTGCRDEFNENPAKYVQKALLRAQAGSDKPASARSSAGKDDGSFDGLFTAPKAARPPATRPAPTTKAEPPAVTAPTTNAGPKDEPTAKDEPAPKPAPGATAAKATSLLRFGQTLERSGNTAGALGYYRQLVKDYPDTEQAKAATERIKALGDQ